MYNFFERVREMFFFFYNLLPKVHQLVQIGFVGTQGIVRNVFFNFKEGEKFFDFVAKVGKVQRTSPPYGKKSVREVCRRATTHSKYSGNGWARTVIWKSGRELSCASGRT